MKNRNLLLKLPIPIIVIMVILLCSGCNVNSKTTYFVTDKTSSSMTLTTETITSTTSQTISATTSTNEITQPPTYTWPKTTEQQAILISKKYIPQEILNYASVQASIGEVDGQLKWTITYRKFSISKELLFSETDSGWTIFSEGPYVQIQIIINDATGELIQKNASILIGPMQTPPGTLGMSPDAWANKLSIQALEVANKYIPQEILNYADIFITLVTNNIGETYWEIKYENFSISKKALISITDEEWKFMGGDGPYPILLIYVDRITGSFTGKIAWEPGGPLPPSVIPLTTTPTTSTTTFWGRFNEEQAISIASKYIPQEILSQAKIQTSYGGSGSSLYWTIVYRGFSISKDLLASETDSGWTFVDNGPYGQLQIDLDANTGLIMQKYASSLIQTG